MFRDAFIDEMAKIGVRMMSGGQQIRVAPQMRRLGQESLHGRKYMGRTDTSQSALREARIKNVESAYQRQRGEPGKVSLPRFGAKAPNAVAAHRAAAAVSAPKVLDSKAAPDVDKPKAPAVEAPKSGPGFFARMKAKFSKEKGPFGPLSEKAERGVQEAHEAHRRQRLGSKYSPPAHVPSSSSPAWAKMSKSDVERKLSEGKKPAITGGASTASPEASKPAKKGILSRTGSVLTHGFNALFPKVAAKPAKKFKIPASIGYQPEPTNIKADV